MNVLSKFDINDKFFTDKFLDIESAQYNLGIIPNIIIDKFLHQAEYTNVLCQLIGRYKHRLAWKKTMCELLENGYSDYIQDAIDIEERHEWFVNTYGTIEDNPAAYDFYHDLVYGV